MRTAPGQLDSERFTDLLAQAAAAVGQQAIGRYDEALALWRGPAFDGVTGRSAAAEAVRLEELRLGALEDRAEAQLAVGRDADVIAELSRLVVDQPLRERPCGQLMLALCRSGRTGDALEAYRRLRARMAAELGLEPGPELQELHQRILAADPALHRSRPAGPGTARQLPPDVSRLIGRDGELGQLDRAGGRRPYLSGGRRGRGGQDGAGPALGGGAGPVAAVVPPVRGHRRG